MGPKNNIKNGMPETGYFYTFSLLQEGFGKAFLLEIFCLIFKVLPNLIKLTPSDFCKSCGIPKTLVKYSPSLEEMLTPNAVRFQN